MLTGLMVADRTKRDLFETRDPDRERRLMRAVDALNRDYGARTIDIGYVGGAKPKSSLRANFISGPHTTSHGRVADCALMPRLPLIGKERPHERDLF
jgi:hypothetical protein